MRCLLLLIVNMCLASYLDAQNNLPPVAVKDVPVVKLRIDPNYARGGRTSQIFDTVIYTPLETRKDVVVGYTHNLQVSKHYFVFFDQDLKGLYVFNRDGKYKTSINKLPLPNWDKQEDGYMFQDFYFDKATERIFVFYRDKTKENPKWLAIFSPDGTMLKNKKLPSLVKDVSFRILEIDSTGDKSLVFAHYNSPKERLDSNLAKFHFYAIQNFDSIKAGMVPVIRDKKMDPLYGIDWIQYYPNQMVGGKTIWSRNFDYTVYRSDEKLNLTKYQILLPLSNSIDSAFYKDTTALKSWDKAFAYFEGKNTLVQAFFGMTEMNNWLIFQMQTRTWPNPMLLYNIKNQHLIDFNKITTDSSSYFLPLKSWRVDASDNGSIYNLIPAYELFNVKSSRTDAPWNASPQLKEYFQKQDRKSNPVIVELKLKSNL